ncbi:hypothetical protein, partial [Moorena sp. SIO3I8]
EGIQASPQADSLITFSLPMKILSKLVIVIAVVVISALLRVAYLEKESLYCNDIIKRVDQGEPDATDTYYDDHDFRRRCKKFLD